MAAGVTAGAFVVFAVALLAGGGVNVWAGHCIAPAPAKGRIAVLTLGVPNLFVLPFGTALGNLCVLGPPPHESRAVFVTRR